MKQGKNYTDDCDLREILKKYRTVAIVGVSPKPNRDSHKVARFLKAKGYERLIR